MKAGGGRAKGAGFERDVSKMIIAAFADCGITGKDCYRTPLSGGHRFASKSDPGDLVLSVKLEKKFPYSVECKFYKKLDWHRLMRPEANGRSHWGEWWRQAVKAAGKKTPVVVFRENGSPAYAMVPVYVRGLVTSPMLKTAVAGELVRVVLFGDFLSLVRAGRARRA